VFDLGQYKDRQREKNDMASVGWWLGNEFGDFDYVIASKKSDGFKQALEDLYYKLEEDEKIGELQFWCHGGKAQVIYSGTGIFEVDYLTILEPNLHSKSVIWFRCCNALADGNASEFAKQILDVGFGYVAGHTVVIGKNRHKDCYAFIDGEWVGPRTIQGYPTDRLHDYFDL